MYVTACACTLTPAWPCLTRARRQTVLMSSFLSPDMNALIGGSACSNHSGRIRLHPTHPGVLGQVIPQVGV